MAATGETVLTVLVMLMAGLGVLTKVQVMLSFSFGVRLKLVVVPDVTVVPPAVAFVHE